MEKCVLIIEDDADMSELLACSIGMEGFRVEMSRDGAEGLRKATAASPDLVLLDLRLPVVDGFTVCERMRANSRTSRLPILVMSGIPGEMARVSSLESGATEHISKPFTMEFLMSRIRFHLCPNKDAAPAALAG